MMERKRPCSLMSRSPYQVSRAATVDIPEFGTSFRLSSGSRSAQYFVAQKNKKSAPNAIHASKGRIKYIPEKSNQKIGIERSELHARMAEL